MACPNDAARGATWAPQEEAAAVRLSFEAGLRLDEHPYAEEYLPPGLPEPLRTELLCDLLALEWSYRLRRLAPSAPRPFGAVEGPEQIFADACRPDPASGGPVRGRRLRARERLALWCREHPLRAALLAAALPLCLFLASLAGRGDRDPPPAGGGGRATPAEVQTDPADPPR
jgi:hypothetical protein